MSANKHPAPWLKTLRFLTIISWALFFVSFKCLELSYPRKETFFDRFFDLKIYPFWNETYLTYHYITSLILIFVSLTGIFINFMTPHKKKHFVRVTFIFMLLVSVYGWVRSGILLKLIF